MCVWIGLAFLSQQESWDYTEQKTKAPKCKRRKLQLKVERESDGPTWLFSNQ